MSADEILIDIRSVETAKEIFTALVGVMPEKSMSFVLTEEGIQAVKEAEKLADWGIGGNKPKLKIAAMECLDMTQSEEPGAPVNVNFTEYQIKALTEILSVIDRALENHSDGVLKK